MIEQIWFKWASKIWENTNISSSSKEFIVTQAVPCKCCIGQFICDFNQFSLSLYAKWIRWSL